MADPAAKPSEPESPTPEPSSVVQKAAGDYDELDEVARMPPAEGLAWLDVHPPPPGREFTWEIVRLMLEDERDHPGRAARRLAALDEAETRYGDDTKRALADLRAGVHPLCRAT
jgi:hypothetical protein